MKNWTLNEVWTVASSVALFVLVVVLIVGGMYVIDHAHSGDTYATQTEVARYLPEIVATYKAERK